MTTVPATMVDAAAALRRGDLTSRDLVHSALSAIGTHNADTHAFIRVDADVARAAAAVADADLAAGRDRGPLHGLPISLKDLIDIAGQPTTAGSKVFATRVAMADAPVTTRLKDAGAIIIGKTNLHEFALGPTSEDSAWGPVLHPKDHRRLAGGSSGGAAVAVATGMSLGSIGTDTGGSIRIPAAACGLVGLKPSAEEVPAAGVIPLSVTLDHVGPLARTVQDAAWLWSVLAGVPIHTVEAPALQGLRLGVLGGYFAHPIAPDVRTLFDKALSQLSDAGIVLSDAAVPDAALIVDTYVNIVLPEGAHWHAPWLDTVADQYTPTVRDRLLSGRHIPAVAYLQARHRRLRLRQQVDALLEHVDVLVLPTLPMVAPLLGQSEAMLGTDTMPVRAALLKHTQLFNLTGHPAITLPVPARDLSMGVQLIGRRGQTARLLDVAAACEAVICP